jgi:hypothetical protein
MADRITIRIEGQHGSISNLEWPDVPPFAVITGVNGAGKSQLLEVLAYSYDALQPRPRGPMLSQPPQLGGRAHIERAIFEAGEVYHAYGEWPQLGGGGASKEEVRRTIRDMHADHRNQWFWQRLADRLKLTVEEAQALPINDFSEVPI